MVMSDQVDSMAHALEALKAKWSPESRFWLPVDRQFKAANPAHWPRNTVLNLAELANLTGAKNRDDVVEQLGVMARARLARSKSKCSFVTIGDIDKVKESFMNTPSPASSNGVAGENGSSVTFTPKAPMKRGVAVESDDEEKPRKRGESGDLHAEDVVIELYGATRTGLSNARIHAVDADHVNLHNAKEVDEAIEMMQELAEDREEYIRSVKKDRNKFERRCHRREDMLFEAKREISDLKAELKRSYKLIEELEDKLGAMCY